MVGEVYNLDGNVLKSVFEVEYDGKDIVLLHPIDAPDGMMFTIMYRTQDNGLLPIRNPIVGDGVIKLYEQKTGLNTSQIVSDFIGK